MIVRILLAAMLAGLLGGVFATAAQAIRVTPLLLEAERYESGELSAQDSHSHAAPGTTHSQDHSHGWFDPENGIERMAMTLAFNMVSGVAFALLLVAGMLLANRGVDLRSGLVWGLCGFVAFVLAPNLGLPPELPGTVSADLADRQVWWIAAVVCTGSALALFAFARRPLFMAAGVALMLAPHLWGAPQPESHDSLAPASLAAEFAVATIATSLAFWVFLGAVLGFLAGRAWQPQGGAEKAA
jgi:cobalt transporter subunit CbtA